MNQETIDQIINTHGDIQFLEKIKSVVREQRANFPYCGGSTKLTIFINNVLDDHELQIRQEIDNHIEELKQELEQL